LHLESLTLRNSIDEPKAAAQNADNMARPNVFKDPPKPKTPVVEDVEEVQETPPPVWNMYTILWKKFEQF